MPTGRPLSFFCLAFLMALSALPVSAQESIAWGAVSGPAPGPTRSIGGTGLGCIAGAVALPAEGPGWQVVRLSRNRFWGQPALIQAIEGLAARSRARGLPDLWIGDLSQPRGGPMRFGHASHQTGLDADIWLDLTPKPPMPRQSRETINVPSLVLPNEAGIDPQRFTAAHALLIRLTAETPGVDRVFVNPQIKLALCRSHGGEPWLRFVRPWYGHDEHMHLRLRCPAGQSECRDQSPPPAGDGCDASLAWWQSPDAHRPSPLAKGPRPQMPAACRAILELR